MDDNNNYDSRFGDIQSLIKYDLSSEIQLVFLVITQKINMK